jgi:hypothetical protein
MKKLYWKKKSDDHNVKNQKIISKKKTLWIIIIIHIDLQEGQSNSSSSLVFYIYNLIYIYIYMVSLIFHFLLNYVIVKLGC